MKKSIPPTNRRLYLLTLFAFAAFATGLFFATETGAKILGVPPLIFTAPVTNTDPIPNPDGHAQAISSLSSILNPDGTIKDGSTGSFDPKGFSIFYGPNGEPRFMPKTEAESLSTDGNCSDGWDDRFAPVGLGGTGTVVVNAVAVLGSDLYIGGDFDTAGGKPISNIAKWDGSKWSSVGSGVNGTINALSVFGGDLYVGGNFSSAGGISAGNIAKWDGSSWSALGAGTNNIVYAITVSSTDLYVAGNFTLAGGVTVNRVAKWDGSGWSAFGTGINGVVRSLALSGNDLYAGGTFTTAGGVTVANIAKWNGTAWSALGTGANNTVFALAVSGGDIYAGGQFTTAGGVTVNRIAKWDGTNWSAFGTGTNGNVLAIAISGSDLYVGGAFTTAGGVTVNKIAKWDGTNWSGFGTGTGTGTGNVNALAVSGSDLYIGGAFTTAGGVAVNRAAKWNGANWSAFGGQAINGSINAVAVSGSDVYVGGSFTLAGGIAANNIAKWDGTSWTALGAGTTNGTNNIVHALAVSGGDLYVGGQFTTAGGSGRNRVARWNGSAWSSLGSGANNIVYALAVSGSDLYIGGQFTTAGGVTVNRVARWNGTAWSALGTGTDGIVYAISMSDSDLYIGGAFSTAEGMSTGRVAKWDGAVWSSLEFGTETNAVVYALAASGSDLYAGGQFTNAGNSTVNNIAKWNGTTWSALGTGTDNIVRSLEVSGNDLYVGGEFVVAGGVTTNNIAKWDGINWSALGAGTNNRINALAVSGNDLFIGGTFTIAGCHGSGGFGHYDTGTPPPPTPTPTPTPSPTPTQTPCAGGFDPTFGNNGIVIAPVGMSAETANAVIVQPDGKTVAVGFVVTMIRLESGTTAQDRDFGVARYNTDGSLDTTFGNGGKVATDFGTRGDGAYSVAYQSDGKIVVGGRKSTTATGGSTGPGDFAVARYNPDGSLDTTFGDGGKVMTDLGGTTEQADSVAIQSDGKIVAAGRSNGFGIARYNTDGSLDLTFGNEGFIRGTLFSATAMALQSDGKIVVVGRSVSGATAFFAAARFNTDGSFDESFGNGGMVQADIPGYDDEARSVAIDSDGKIVLTGLAYTGGCGVSECRRFGTVRLNTDGTLDTSFGGTGIVIMVSNPANPSYQFNEAHGVVIQPDNKVVVGGTGMVRYNVNGTLDTTFGTGGGVSPAVGVATYHPAISPDGKIVVVGSTGNSSTTGSNFGMLRLLSNGQMDTTFGDNGIVITDFGRGRDFARAITLQPDGKILTAGIAIGNPNASALVRFNAQGTLDSSFGTGGIVLHTNSSYVEEFRSVALQSDGKILAGGYTNTQTLGTNFLLGRYNANGSPDTSFGSSGTGFVTTNIAGVDELSAVAVQANGRIVAAGYSGSTSLKDFVLFRYNTGGLPDISFGTNGIVTTPVGNFSDEAHSMAIQPDGKIVLAGYAAITTTNTDFAVVRYNENGSLDNTFGLGGKVMTNIGGSNEEANSMALQSDGKIVVAGFTNNGTSDDFAVIRYNSNGSLDNTFGSGGKVTTSIGSGNDIIRSVNIQPNGKIVAVGSTDTGSGLGFAAARYNSDGTLDGTFGIGGILVTTSVSDGDNEAFASAIDPLGRIIAAGYGVVNGNTDSAIVRYLDNCSGTTPTPTPTPTPTATPTPTPTATPTPTPTPTPVDVKAPYDFDGDGKSDVGVFRPGVGEWWYLRSSDQQARGFQFGAGTDVPVPGDHTGDGKADIAFYRPSSGEWYILRSEDSTFYGFPFGTTGDVAMPGDFDGDGKTDAAVFRPSSGNWFILRSSDQGLTATNFGLSGDRPITADFDGDGKSDVGIFRPSAGEWWYLRSIDQQARGFQFGTSTDRTVVGDYTGDGKSDIAFFRPATGEWFILRSEDSSFYGFPFGTAGDIPAPGDFDGDGKFDPAVFRPSAGNWFVLGSTSGVTATHFGQSGDQPIPNAFVR